MSVTTLLSMPLAEGLFAQAIAEPVPVPTRWPRTWPARWRATWRSRSVLRPNGRH